MFFKLICRKFCFRNFIYEDGLMQFAYKEIFISSDIVLNLVQSSLLIFLLYFIWTLQYMPHIILLISLKINCLMN